MRSFAVICLVAAAIVAGGVAGSARAADECRGIRVCLPVAGPWVVVPRGGVEYEAVCPRAAPLVAGTDARLAASDIDVSFRGEVGSPVTPGVTTRSSVVFSAFRLRPAEGITSFRPFIGCIPTRGGGGRALTGVTAQRAGIRPTQPLTTVVVTRRLRFAVATIRVRCQRGGRLVRSTTAVAFRRSRPPSASLAASVTMTARVVSNVVVARVTATSTATSAGAEAQVRAVCTRAP